MSRVPKVEFVAKWIVAFFLLCNLPSMCQTRQRGDVQTGAYTLNNSLRAPDLADENYARVAASAAELKDVLSRNTGLMVELKRWIAKEATDNGQIIEDSDLSDQAVLGRLDRDITFRSVATRLVQRYGYLIPAPNPDSDFAKEQDLILKERARRFVALEAQEDSEWLEQPKKASASDQGPQAEPCDRMSDGDCESLRSTYRKGHHYRQSEPSLPDNYSVPIPLRPPEVPSVPMDQHTLRAFGHYDDQRGSALDRSSLSYSALSSSGLSSSGLSSAALSPSEPLSTYGASSSSLGLSSGLGLSTGLGLGLDFGLGFGSDLGGIGQGPSLRDLMAARGGSLTGSYGASDLDSRGMNGAPMRSMRSWRREQDRLDQNEQDANRVKMVRTANPYADVPSLYDMYVQAAVSQRPAERFGLEVFRDSDDDSNYLPMDLPVGPDYTVGPGDSLSIDLWGGISQRLTRTVDREGRISLPESGPLLVSGKSLGDVQAAVQKMLRGQYRDVSADVSVSRLRTVRVYVVGEVLHPGAYDVSSLSTPLNGLIEAGGITERGSLREIKHYRGKELIQEVDAYDLLLHGIRSDLQRLENGDTLLVPPLGPEVTVEGMVRRPATYELLNETSLAQVLELAGGILPTAALRHIEVQRLEAHKKRTMLSLDLTSVEADEKISAQLSAFKIKGGDTIHIFPIAGYNEDAIYLQGHVLRPGRYSYKDGMKITDLISSYKDLLPEPAQHYAEIIRINAPDFHPTIESFDLGAALAHPESAPLLKPLDTVRIFGRYDFEAPPDVWVGGEVRFPGKYRTSGQAHLRDAIYLAGGISPDAALDTAQLFRTEPDGKMTIHSVDLRRALIGDPDENIVLQPRDRLLVHRSSERVEPPTVYIKGEVTKPGRYLLTSNMHVDDLVHVAGGLKRSAYTETADLTRFAAANAPSDTNERFEVKLAAAMSGDADENLPLRNGDVLTIGQTPHWEDLGSSIVVRGEVQHPATYGIEPGERLSSVLKRCGGFTAQAYPYGAILVRREVRDMEMQTHAELIERMKSEEQYIKALPEGEPDQKNAKMMALAQMQTTLKQLQQATPVGRVVIHIPPDAENLSKLANSPADIALRNGDELIIPKRNNYIMVNGQVFNPTAVSYLPGKNARWYLSQAGGITPVADKGAVFVIRADGSVVSAKNNSGMWSGDPMKAVLRAGDSIVVPEKAPKVSSRNLAPYFQAAQVASSVALAIAYIHP